MQLQIHINDLAQTLIVDESLLEEAEAFFTKMDQDMNQGYQMSRQWVPAPSQLQRCQIVADRILTALTNGKQHVAVLMAAYILKRCPGTTRIDLNTEGDMSEHLIE